VRGKGSQIIRRRWQAEEARREGNIAIFFAIVIVHDNNELNKSLDGLVSVRWHGVH